MGEIQLKNIYPSWMSDGFIFKAFTQVPNYTPPWGIDNYSDLDFAYLGHSGNKVTSPMVDLLLNNETITPENLARLAGIAVTIYGVKWEKLYATLSLEYNPIENYAMIENENSTANATQDNAVYGFNSTTESPSDTQTGENALQRELTRSGNIGVTTSQQMLQSEIELWQWIFFEQMFKDLDKYLTTQVY